MNKRVFQLFDLTEEQAITLLETPSAQLEAPEDRYIAASQLIKYPTERAINALIKVIEQETVTDLNSRITRRKAVETLGHLQAKVALPTICTCLQDEDCYTVENAVWAIGEIGTDDPTLLEAVAQLLQRPGQNYRVIIHVLAKLAYSPAIESVRAFTTHTDLAIASAANTLIYRLTGDQTAITPVVELLQHDGVNARRACIQDLIDARYYAAIPAITHSPVSMVFRLRAIRLMAEAGIPAGELTFAAVQPHLERTIRDHPQHLEFVHEYDQTPSLDFAINELYETDFGRCYLATHTLLTVYAETAPEALMATYRDRAQGDYGAHYHVMKLFGWLKYTPAYDLLVEALHNTLPQFQKSRTAAAIALGELGQLEAIPELQQALNTDIWTLQYACLMAMSQLQVPIANFNTLETEDVLVKAKVSTLQEGNLFLRTTNPLFI